MIGAIVSFYLAIFLLILVAAVILYFEWFKPKRKKYKKWKNIFKIYEENKYNEFLSKAYFYEENERNFGEVFKYFSNRELKRIKKQNEDFFHYKEEVRNRLEDLGNNLEQEENINKKELFTIFAKEIKRELTLKEISEVVINDDLGSFKLSSEKIDDEVLSLESSFISKCFEDSFKISFKNISSFKVGKIKKMISETYFLNNEKGLDSFYLVDLGMEFAINLYLEFKKETPFLKDKIKEIEKKKLFINYIRWFSYLISKFIFNIFDWVDRSILKKYSSERSEITIYLQKLMLKNKFYYKVSKIKFIKEDKGKNK